MRGELTERTAADLCRDLAAEHASGVLAIDGPDGSGTITFADGHIVDARSSTPRARLGDRLVAAAQLDPADLDEARRLQGAEDHEGPRLGAMLADRGLVDPETIRRFVQDQILDALFDAVQWRAGSFSFTAGGEPPDGILVALPVDDALVEVSRRRDQWQELSKVVPDLEAVPVFRDGAATATASMEPDEFTVLAAIDGERSVRAIAASLGYLEFDTARIVYGLRLLGLVDVEPPRDDAGPRGATLDITFDVGPTTEPMPPPPMPPPGDSRPEPDAGPEADGQPEPGAQPDPDASEFLRELSRLTGDSTAPAATTPHDQPPGPQGPSGPAGPPAPSDVPAPPSSGPSQPSPRDEPPRESPPPPDGGTVHGVTQPWRRRRRRLFGRR